MAIRGQRQSVVRRHGAWVEVPGDQEGGPAASEKSLRSMSRAELDTEAKTRGLDPADFANKQDLLDALEK